MSNLSGIEIEYESNVGVGHETYKGVIVTDIIVEGSTKFLVRTPRGEIVDVGWSFITKVHNEIENQPE